MNAIARREPRKYVDLSSVPPSQWAMHDRLQNWALWSRGSPGRIAKASPMFNLYRSSEAKRAYGEETTVPIDHKDATRVAVGVTALPDKHRRAIHWCYLHPRDAMGQARELGVNLEGLSELIRHGRQMLINKGV